MQEVTPPGGEESDMWRREMLSMRFSLITDIRLRSVRFVPEADLENVTRKVMPNHQWSDDDAHSHPIADLVRRLFSVRCYSIPYFL